MTIICPTVLATTADEYKLQLERASKLSSRIQIDLADGKFAPNQTVNPAQIYWPEQTQADIHLMFQSPAEQLDTLLALKPSMVILHAEAEGNIAKLLLTIKQFGIKAGIGLLPETAVEEARMIIQQVDHVLIFGGRLGYFSHEADLKQLVKVGQIKSINSKVEVGWDGGANQHDVKQIAEAGVDVINVGSFIQQSESPDEAYAILQKMIGVDGD